MDSHQDMLQPSFCILYISCVKLFYHYNRSTSWFFFLNAKYRECEHAVIENASFTWVTSCPVKFTSIQNCVNLANCCTVSACYTDGRTRRCNSAGVSPGLWDLTHSSESRLAGTLLISHFLPTVPHLWKFPIILNNFWDYSHRWRSG